MISCLLFYPRGAAGGRLGRALSSDSNATAVSGATRWFRVIFYWTAFHSLGAGAQAVLLPAGFPGWVECLRFKATFSRRCPLPSLRLGILFITLNLGGRKKTENDELEFGSREHKPEESEGGSDSALETSSLRGLAACEDQPPSLLEGNKIAIAAGG